MQPKDRSSIRETVTSRLRDFRYSWDFSPSKIWAMFLYIPVFLFTVLVYLIKYLIKGLIWLANNKLQHLVIFTCSIILIYFIFSYTPFWLRYAVAGVAVMLLSSVGLSFLDYRYGVFERSLEDKMLHHARKQFALGIDDKEDKEDQSVAGQQLGATLLGPEKIELVFKHHGIDVRHVDSMESAIEYTEVFYTDSPRVMIPADLPKNIKDQLPLKTVPVIHVDKNLIYVHIYKTGK